jgi:tRNA/rRNA methyltransferase
MKPFFMYMLQCNDGSYYVGHTDNIESRISAHNQGFVEGYTKKRLPVTVVYVQCFGTRIEAITAERQVKGWSRRKKQALAENDWDKIKAISNE